MEKPVIGYTAGVFDLFHIGHLNVLKEAKSLCSKLIVGVSTSELAISVGKHPVVPFSERIQIVEALKYVDIAIPQETLNKYDMWRKLKFDILFVGDDWFDSFEWRKYERKLLGEGVKTIYFPYTKNISSTLMREKIK
jgi:glycerol-3-phosphate cytidylyltransferase